MYPVYLEMDDTVGELPFAGTVPAAPKKRRNPMPQSPRREPWNALVMRRPHSKRALYQVLSYSLRKAEHPMSRAGFLKGRKLYQIPEETENCSMDVQEEEALKKNCGAEQRKAPGSRETMTY